MALTSWDAIAAAVAASVPKAFVKASVANALAGGYTSLYRAAGNPSAPAIPGSTWATPARGDVGFFDFTSPSGANLGRMCGVDLAFQTAGTVVWLDRLGHRGGLSGTVVTPTAQTVNGTIPANREAAADGSDVEWWLEWYTDTGSSAVTATVTYTNQNDVGSRTCTVALAATMRAGRMLPIIPTTSGDRIKSVQSVTLSATTGTAGSFGVTCTRRLASSRAASAGGSAIQNALDLKVAKFAPTAAIFAAVSCTTTSTGQITGVVHLGEG